MKMERSDGLKGYTLMGPGVGVADPGLEQRDEAEDGFISLY